MRTSQAKGHLELNTPVTVDSCAPFACPAEEEPLVQPKKYAFQGCEEQEASVEAASKQVS